MMSAFHCIHHNLRSRNTRIKTPVLRTLRFSLFSIQFTLKMHEITYTTGDAILHGRRRTTRRWKARKRLKKYTREPALSARSSRRETRAKMKIHVFCYFFRNHRYCFPYFRVFRPRKSCFWKISFCYSP